MYIFIKPTEKYYLEVHIIIIILCTWCKVKKITSLMWKSVPIWNNFINNPVIITFITTMYACVHVCVWVYTPPKPLITSGVILTLNNWWNKCSFNFMALAADVIERRGYSNEMRYQSQPKKVVFAVYIVAKHVLHY